MDGSMIIIFVVYIGALVLFGYFAAIRPGRKRKKEREALMSNMKPGDFVLTSSGFYGKIVDIIDDTVVVEFGNNRNCRISMKKEAIDQVEPAETQQTTFVGDKPNKEDK